MTRTPPKKWLTFLIFHWSERPPRKGPTFWNSGASDELHFFSANRDIFMGVKAVLPFSKLIIGKSQFFQRACTCICRDTRKYVAGVPSPSRVNISCMSKVSGPLFLYQSYHLNNQGGRTKRGHTFESLEPNLQNLTMHRNFFQPLLRSIK